MTPRSGRHQRTLEQIFSEPVSGTIRYEDVKNLLQSVGSNFSNKGKTSGARLSFTINGTKILLHKPHPGSEMGKATIKQLREILKKLGITP